MNKKLKRILLTLTALILLVAIAFGCLCFGIFFHRQGTPLSEDAFSVRADSLVLMIGDGMGFNHLATADAFKRQTKGEGLFLTSGSETSSGAVTTHSTALLFPTDSAAAATAMSTGVKTANGKIARKRGKDLMTISEYAMSLGKATGIIATETLTGATPAAFSAHAGNRGNKKEIILSQLGSGIDLFIGEGAGDYDPYAEKIVANGYTRITNPSLLDKNANKLFANVDVGIGEEQPSLAFLCGFALEFLYEKSGNGFFLMAEGSRIDKRSHANDLEGMIKQLLAFDDAVRAVYERLPPNTVLLVTADHETGALRYEKGTDYSTARFSRSWHSSADVPYFAFNLDLPAAIDNTDVFRAGRLLFGD